VCCKGHFLGLTVCNTGYTDSRLQSAVYECDVDDDVSDGSDQFDDMMRNLGAVGLLEKFVQLGLLLLLTIVLIIILILILILRILFVYQRVKRRS